jgi:AhpD family alkylhydroperoxidase
MPSDRPMPVAPMPVEDLSPLIKAHVSFDEHRELTEGWFGFLAKAGELTDLFVPYYVALSGSLNVLGPKLTEMVRLAIATTTGCEACLSYQDSRALDAGLAANVVTLFDELDRADFSPRERIAVRYALTFCTNHHKIDDAMWDELRVQFDDQELVTLCLYVATYLGTGRMAHAIRLIDAHCTIPGYRLAAVVNAQAAEGQGQAGRKATVG